MAAKCLRTRYFRWTATTRAVVSREKLVVYDANVHVVSSGNVGLSPNWSCTCVKIGVNPTEAGSSAKIGFCGDADRSKCPLRPGQNSNCPLLLA